MKKRFRVNILYYSVRLLSTMGYVEGLKDDIHFSQIYREVQKGKIYIYRKRYRNIAQNIHLYRGRERKVMDRTSWTHSIAIRLYLTHLLADS